MTGRLNSAQPYAIGLFRIVIGLLFTCHGAQSLLGVLGGMDGKGATVETGAWPNWYAAVIELVGGALVLLGLGTRFAAFIASGAMAYAYFKVHQPQGLWPIENQGEGAAMYCWSMFLLVFTGSGALGVDRLFSRRTSSATAGERSSEPVAA
ncbi:DoxX family protein [Streptomyces sporangiiformans]|uniref:DoxX family protein n=1 Tax=Streptomyces sporangiiformans TaxID=2315329 RepID=A0A505D7X3_9ACTN|nr:DoxX family protein [Streptomyces sporangiiformans]TPQ17865.1 DoxX family protein [Streptomyces sporangiiformans]